MNNKTLEEFSWVIIGLMFTLMTMAFGFEGFFEMVILLFVPIIVCSGKEILKIGVSILFSLLIIGILCFLIYLLFKYNITVVTTLIILGIGSLKVNGIGTYFLIRNLLYKNIK